MKKVNPTIVLLTMISITSLIVNRDALTEIWFLYGVWRVVKLLIETE